MYMCRHTSMDRWRPIVLLHYWRGGGGGDVGKDGYEARSTRTRTMGSGDELHTICGTQLTRRRTADVLPSLDGGL